MSIEFYVYVRRLLEYYQTDDELFKDSVDEEIENVIREYVETAEGMILDIDRIRGGYKLFITRDFYGMQGQATFADLDRILKRIRRENIILTDKGKVFAEIKFVDTQREVENYYTKEGLKI